MPGTLRSLRFLPLAAFLLAAALPAVLVGCGGGSGSGSVVPPPLPPPPPATKGKYFTHIVILVQENRSFDNLFATFPGADGARRGKTHNGGTLLLRSANLESPISPGNSYPDWQRDWNGGKMNGFDTVNIGKVSGTYVYEYVDPAQIAPYWDLAKSYVLSDHTFQTQGSGSFTAHQDLIRGGTDIGAHESLIDFPNDWGHQWGCDAPLGTRTSLITANNQYRSFQGPYPCLQYETLRDLLDAKSISWRYYTPAAGNFGGNLWNAFDAIDAVRHGSEWNTNVASPETSIFTDINRNTLPAVAWVIPDFRNSDHPGDKSDTGPSWIAQVVNAIGQSAAWKTTAILVVWDDWGGWYDHVAPVGTRRYGGLGFRVPLLAVAPYSKDGYVSHNGYQFGSIIRFVEDNWSLGRLGTTDVRSADFVGDFFDFSQNARTFVPIQSKYSQSYLLHQPPSNHAVDDE